MNTSSVVFTILIIIVIVVIVGVIIYSNNLVTAPVPNETYDTVSSTNIYYMNDNAVTGSTSSSSILGSTTRSGSSTLR